MKKLFIILFSSILLVSCTSKRDDNINAVIKSYESMGYTFDDKLSKITNDRTRLRFYQKHDQYLIQFLLDSTNNQFYYLSELTLTDSQVLKNPDALQKIAVKWFITLNKNSLGEISDSIMPKAAEYLASLSTLSNPFIKTFQIKGRKVTYTALEGKSLAVEIK